MQAIHNCDVQLAWNAARFQDSLKISSPHPPHIFYITLQLFVFSFQLFEFIGCSRRDDLLNFVHFVIHDFESTATNYMKTTFAVPVFWFMNDVLPLATRWLLQLARRTKNFNALPCNLKTLSVDFWFRLKLLLLRSRKCFFFFQLLLELGTDTSCRFGVGVGVISKYLGKLCACRRTERPNVNVFAAQRDFILTAITSAGGISSLEPSTLISG